MTKDELQEIMNLDNRIESKLRQLEELRDTITSIQGIDYSKDKVQTSPIKAIENSIIKLMKLEEGIAKDIDELVDKKQKARKVINDIEGIYGTVLEMRYLECMEFEEVAYRLCYSIQHIHRLHGQALLQVEKKMRVNESEC